MCWRKAACATTAAFPHCGRTKKSCAACFPFENAGALHAPASGTWLSCYGSGHQRQADADLRGRLLAIVQHRHAVSLEVLHMEIAARAPERAAPRPGRVELRGIAALSLPVHAGKHKPVVLRPA